MPRLTAAVAACLLAIAGCAPIPQGAAIPGRPVTARDTSKAHQTAAALPGQPHHAPVDSLPSAEALQVLASIPEPLKPEERVPPPRAVAGTSVVPADTLASDIPVPSPTPVLGERRHPLWAAATDSAAADSARRALGEAGSSPSPAPGSGPASGTGKSGSVPETEAPRATPGSAAPHPLAPAACWRVQVAAPVKRDEAVKKRSAAESLLLVPMVIERDQGLWKIRTRDCFERPIADQVRARAQGSGFAGAFPFQIKH